ARPGASSAVLLGIPWLTQKAALRCSAVGSCWGAGRERPEGAPATAGLSPGPGGRKGRALQLDSASGSDAPAVEASCERRPRDRRGDASGRASRRTWGSREKARGG